MPCAEAACASMQEAMEKLKQEHERLLQDKVKWDEERTTMSRQVEALTTQNDQLLQRLKERAAAEPVLETSELIDIRTKWADALQREQALSETLRQLELAAQDASKEEQCRLDEVKTDLELKERELRKVLLEVDRWKKEHAEMRSNAGSSMEIAKDLEAKVAILQEMRVQDKELVADVRRELKLKQMEVATFQTNYVHKDSWQHIEAQLKFANQENDILRQQLAQLQEAAKKVVAPECAIPFPTPRIPTFDDRPTPAPCVESNTQATPSTPPSRSMHASTAKHKPSVVVLDSKEELEAQFQAGLELDHCLDECATLYFENRQLVEKVATIEAALVGVQDQQAVLYRLALFEVNQARLARQHNILMDEKHTEYTRRVAVEDELLDVEKALKTRLQYLESWKLGAMQRMQAMQKALHQSVLKTHYDALQDAYHTLHETYANQLDRWNSLHAVYVEALDLKAENTKLLHENALLRVGPSSTSSAATLQDERIQALEITLKSYAAQIKELTNPPAAAPTPPRHAESEHNQPTLQVVLEHRIAELEQCCTALQQDVEKHKSIAALAASQANTLALRQTRHRDEVSQLEERLRELGSRSDDDAIIGQLQQRLLTIQANYHSFTDRLWVEQIDQLAQSNVPKETFHEKWRHEKAALQGKLDQALYEMDGLKTKCSKLLQESSQKDVKLRDLQLKLDNLVYYEKDHLALQEAAQATIASLKALVNDKNIRIDEYQRQLEKMREEFDAKQRAAHEDQERRNRRLYEDNHVYIGQLKEAMDKIQQLEEHIDQLRQGKKTAEIRCGEALEEIAALQKVNHALVDDVESAQKDKARQTAQWKADLQAKDKKMALLRDAIIKLKEEFLKAQEQQAEENVREKRKQLSQHDDRVDNLTEKNAQLTAKCTMLQEKAEGLQTDLDDLNKKYKRAMALVARAKVAPPAVSRESQELKSTVSELREELNRCKTKLGTYSSQERDLDVLQARVKVLESKNAALREAAATAQEPVLVTNQDESDKPDGNSEKRRAAWEQEKKLKRRIEFLASKLDEKSAEVDKVTSQCHRLTEHLTKTQLQLADAVRFHVMLDGIHPKRPHRPECFYSQRLQRETKVLELSFQVESLQIELQRARQSATPSTQPTAPTVEGKREPATVTTVAALEDVISNMKRVMEKLRSENERLRKHLKPASKHAASNATKELQQLSAVLDGSKAELQQLRVEHADLARKFRALGAKYKTLKDAQKSHTSSAAYVADMERLHSVQLQEKDMQIHALQQELILRSSAHASPREILTDDRLPRDDRNVELIRRLREENARLTEELSAFDLDFFDEIEDLKFKYAQAVRQKQALEKQLANSTRLE
ncbi:hypothetical protein DYB32_005607 [Aphanomyces invadans]|uniref:Uncharacterized protein n=1 Tax=Aphanomyces invadans TaxID=157072 RepID=A0A3R6WL93_9STRA|nr:hypothetical protein DYB32_005607 [Aphanomyces invadans]